MTYILGFITGLVLGFLLKRSDICFTGLIRDIYLQSQKHNIALFIAIVSTEGLIYHVLGHLGMIRIPSYLPPFSLLAVAIGSFVFGMGAVPGGSVSFPIEGATRPLRVRHNGQMQTLLFLLQAWPTPFCCSSLIIRHSPGKSKHYMEVL